MELLLAWWNTSLSPTFRLRDRSTEEERDAARAVISLLTAEEQFSLIALCEVSPGDIQRFGVAGAYRGYRLHQITEPAGRSAFNMCVFYHPERMALVQSVPILSSVGDKTLRIAQHLTFAVNGESQPFEIFLSHWPSRLQMQQYVPMRHLLGTRLRDAANLILERDSQARIIFLGDYNDEPFDASITDCLMATRDRQLVARRKHLFYNPFWRHLSPFSGLEDGLASVNDQGSYFHKAGDLTRWRTFDQMIFSSTFVRDGEWQVDEINTRVLNIQFCIDLVMEPNMHFDHLPVIGRVVKKVV